MDTFKKVKCVVIYYHYCSFDVKTGLNFCSRRDTGRSQRNTMTPTVRKEKPQGAFQSHHAMGLRSTPFVLPSNQ